MIDTSYLHRCFRELMNKKISKGSVILRLRLSDIGSISDLDSIIEYMDILGFDKKNVRREPEDQLWIWMFRSKSNYLAWGINTQNCIHRQISREVYYKNMLVPVVH